MAISEERRERMRAATRRWRARNLEENRRRDREWKRAHPERHRPRSWKQNGIVSATTGKPLSWSEFCARLETQGGRCAICVSNDPGIKYGFLADHDHATGLFRGVLCNSCNISLGFYERIGAAPGRGLSLLLQAYLDAHAKAVGS